MHGGEREAPGLDAELLHEPGPRGALALAQQLVDDGVAGDVDALAGHAFAEQQVARARRRREQVLGQVIGEDAVDLLRHGAIVRAQAGFDVAHLDAELVRGHGARQHRVRVALHQQDVGPLPLEDRLHAEHDRADLVRLAARAHLQVDVGLRQLQLPEEHAVELERVMLAGVDQHVRHLARAARADHGRHLHDLGPGADGDRDPHRDPPARLASPPPPGPEAPARSAAAMRASTARRE